jgi:preprotein translocase subunit SecG
MSLSTILSGLHLVSGILLIAVILLQQKGSGLGAAFGGSGNVYSTKRGIDKVLYQATIGISIVFFGTALVVLIVA